MVGYGHDYDRTTQTTETNEWLKQASVANGAVRYAKQETVPLESNNSIVPCELT